MWRAEREAAGRAVRGELREAARHAPGLLLLSPGLGSHLGLGGLLGQMDFDLVLELLQLARQHCLLPGLGDLEAQPVARRDGDRLLRLGVDPLPLLRLLEAEGAEVGQAELPRLFEEGQNPLQDSADDLFCVLLGQFRGPGHVADQIVPSDSACWFCHGLVPPFCLGLHYPHDHEIDPVADRPDDEGAEDPARLLEEGGDEPGGPLRWGDVRLQGGNAALKVADPPGVLPAGKVLDDIGDPPDLGEEIRHHLAIGLEARLVGLLKEADRLVQGCVSVIQLLSLPRELRDALKEKLRVPIIATVDAAFGAVSHGLIISFLVAT